MRAVPCRGCGRRRAHDLRWGLCIFTGDWVEASVPRCCWFRFQRFADYNGFEHHLATDDVGAAVVDLWLEAGKPLSPKRPPQSWLLMVPKSADGCPF